MDRTVNTLIVSNISWAHDLSQNLLNTIFLAKKGIEVFLKRTGQLSEIYFEDEVIRQVDIIDNQYIIRLAKFFVPKVIVVKNLTPKIWHAQLGHLSYGAMQKMASVALGMELKGLLSLEICKGCMVGRQQW